MNSDLMKDDSVRTSRRIRNKDTCNDRKYDVQEKQKQVKTKLLQ